MSERLGISTQKLQELTYAAGPLGEEGLGTGLRLLARNANEAATGNKEAAKAFRTLGVHVRDANGQLLPADQLLSQVADGMQGMTNDTERVAIATQLFGRDGMRMINMLKDGSAGLDAMGAEARDLGFIMSDELMASTEAAHKAEKKFDFALQALRNTIAAKLIPGATWLLTTLLAMVKRFRELLAGSKMVEVAIAALGSAMALLALTGVVRLLSSLGSLAMSALSLAGAFGAAGNAALLMQLKSMLIGGAILVLAAVIALLADEIAVMLTGGETAFAKWELQIERWYDSLMKMDFSKSPILNFIREVLKGLDAAKELGFGWIMALAGDESARAAVRRENLLGPRAEPIPGTEGMTPYVAPGFLDKLKEPGGFLEGILGPRPFVPASAGAITSNRAINAPQISTNITVNAAPGQSPDQIGSAVANAFDEHLKNWVETQASDLLPRAAAAGGGG
jgi:hypothetical protein